MNGVDRESEKHELYYTYLVPYSKNVNPLYNGQYMYSFSLCPLNYQPSGTANFTETSDPVILMNFNNKIRQKLIDNDNLNAKAEL